MYASTIVALATPNGRSGLGVIRLSGPAALRITRALVREPQFLPTPRFAMLRSVFDEEAGIIDSAVITYYQNPRSFTGEDVVEISCHGSPVVLRQVIDICLQNGARLAEPGEFTLRALTNGRLDLPEAEAVRDLIDAQTSGAARQAIRQLKGELSKQLQPLKEDLLDLIVILESALEFVEDDIPAAHASEVRLKLTRIVEETQRLAGTFRHGHLLRDGIRIAIVGRPNVGKSSLFNALLGSDRAIVTDIAGTTRDQLHERLIIGEIPISLIDTAGMRETADLVESIGVGRAKAAMADADLVMIMLDASGPVTDEDLEIIEDANGLRSLVALNKIDAVPSEDIVGLTSSVASSSASLRERVIPISAKTGEGLSELKSAVATEFGGIDHDDSGFLITDARHHDLLSRAAAEITKSVEQLDARVSEEIVLIGLHNALRYLGQITGETTTEDVLTRIFSTFCIGK